MECRSCGCTEYDACVDEATGFTCHWTERDLCSFCQTANGETARLVELVSDAEATAYLQSRR